MKLMLLGLIKGRCKIIAVVAFLFFLTFLHSQNFRLSNDWKKYRKDVSLRIGAANFLGDLGGLDKTGTDFSPIDMEWKTTKVSFSIAYRYKIAKWLNLVFDASYLKVTGDDKLTKDIYRNNRNLNFKSNIFETAGKLEFSYLRSVVGHRYGLKNTRKKRMKTKAEEYSLFIGCGGFYFNPKGKDKNGNWVRLHPLHTEGQGLPNGPKQYKRVSVCIPVGFSYRVIYCKIWSIGVEFGFRKTFTDYLDDVSTRYYDKKVLKASYGNKALEMSDPSLGNIYGATEPDASGLQAQRGDKEKDSYMSLQVSLGYILKPKRKVRRSRLKSKF